MKKSSTLSDPSLGYVSEDELEKLSPEDIPNEIIAYAEENGPGEMVMKNIMNYSKALDIVDSESAGEFDVILN